LLFVPRAWDAEKYQYKMDRIDVSRPLLETEVKSHPVLADLKAFYAKAKEKGIFPADYELYIQPDGRVAMIDFDKFAKILSDGSVQFPWGFEMSADQVQENLKILLG
jgi:hypothetical protein